MKKHFSMVLLIALLCACNPASPTGTTAPIPSGTPVPPASTPLAPPSTPTGTPWPVTSPMCEDEDCLQEGLPLDYLVVTRPMFKEVLVPFIEWKTANGFRTGLVTVEWLDSTYPGRHMAERMKTGMHDLRKRSGAKFVLLVGDTEIASMDFSIGNMLASYTLDKPFNVPTGFYRRVDTDPADEIAPSDAYFVEERDWDPGNTGLNPRPDNMQTGEGTLQADLFLGRWPVRDAVQLAILIEKTKTMKPSRTIFFSADNALGEGTTTNCSAWPPGQYDEFACYLDQMFTGRTRFFESNAPQLTTESLFIDTTDHEQVAAFLDRVRSNEGVLALLYHGNLDCLGLLSTCYPAQYIEFDHAFPLMELTACVVASYQFDGGLSAGEIFFFAQPGPAVFSQSPNPVLFLRDLRDGKPVGEAFWATASAYVYWPNPMLLFGDPSLIIFAGAE